MCLLKGMDASVTAAMFLFHGVQQKLNPNAGVRHNCDTIVKLQSTVQLCVQFNPCAKGVSRRNTEDLLQRPDRCCASGVLLCPGRPAVLKRLAHKQVS